MSHPSNELSDAALDALIAHERARVATPLTDWQALSAQLRAEGLVHQTDQLSERSFGDSSPARPFARSRFTQWGRQVFAGAALLGIGVLVGRGVSVQHDGTSASTAVASVAVQKPAPAATFASLADARQVLVHAQTQSRQAASYIAAHDTSAQIVGGAEMYKERLAALDEISEAALSQVKATSGDPVLTRYYQSITGARAATLQRLGKVLPAGYQIATY